MSIQPFGNFTCEICRQEKNGVSFKLHVINYQEEIPEPREISIVCEFCKNNRVIEAGFYCPLTSAGRDSWNHNEPKYDCFCFVPQEET